MSGQVRIESSGGVLAVTFTRPERRNAITVAMYAALADAFESAAKDDSIRVITIGGAMCLATVFAALAKAMPEATGPYDYVARSLGGPPAFFVMWSYWISTWVTNAAISIAAALAPISSTP